jgi:hypothetical protein
MKTKNIYAIQTESIFDFKTVATKENIPKGCLAVLEGYATLTDDTTNKNAHFYPKGFWKSVLDGNEYIQEKLATKTFYGSFRHPEDGESPTPEFGDVCFNVRSYKIDDKGVYVVIDILDTEQGRAVLPLIEYGSQLGISTRAYGEVTVDSKGFKVPVLDEYVFITWDLVAYPAFSETRMTISDVALGTVPDSLLTFKNKSELFNSLKGMPKNVKLFNYLGVSKSKTLNDSVKDNEGVSELDVVLKKMGCDFKAEECTLKKTDAGVDVIYNDESVVVVDESILTEAQKSMVEKESVETTEDSDLQDALDKILELEEVVSVLKDTLLKTTNELDGVNIALTDKQEELDAVLAAQEVLEGEVEQLKTEVEEVLTDNTKLKNLCSNLQSSLNKDAVVVMKKIKQTSDKDATASVYRRKPLFTVDNEKKKTVVDSDEESFRVLIKKRN